MRFILPSSIDDFDNITERLDHYNLSAIGAPANVGEQDPDNCAAFGERARELCILVGEASFGGNLMSPDREMVEQRIEALRRSLRNADLMQCRTLHILVGTRDESDHMLAAHPYMYTDECKAELREIILRVMDGLELQYTRFLIEPFNNSFFYQPEDIREFLDAVDHPRVGVHADAVNMIAFDTYFDTTSLINRTFDLLADYIFSAHVKDLRWDHRHLILKWTRCLSARASSISPPTCAEWTSWTRTPPVTASTYPDEDRTPTISPGCTKPRGTQVESRDPAGQRGGLRSRLECLNSGQAPRAADVFSVSGRLAGPQLRGR